MTVIRAVHEDHGASFLDRGGRAVVADYGRPARAARAVRSAAGVTEAAYGVLSIEGEDRVDYVDNVLSNAVPRSEGTGCYAVLLDPDGRVRTDAYVYHAGERLLLFLPPGRATPIAEEWRENVFIEDVTIDVATDDYAVFGVHGPRATEKIASVLGQATPPEEQLTFVRGRLADVGVTVVRTDAPIGEEGYELVCAAADADEVFDVLLNYGQNAAPFGWRTWDQLTLEAGTPLFATELEGRIPNAVGIRTALDFEKGCYVGQEVVSRIENRGQPPERLVGLTIDDGGDHSETSDDAERSVTGDEETAMPENGAAVVAGDAAVGEVTRAAASSTLDRTVAMAFVDADVEPDTDVAVQIGGESVPASVADLPFVDGSERSARVPEYE